MNKLNLIIFKLPALYEIFEEIKSELNFNFFYYSEINNEFKNLVSKNPKILVICSEKNKYFKNYLNITKALKIRNLIHQIKAFSH